MALRGTARKRIVEAAVEAINTTIDGTGDWTVDLQGVAEPRLFFWDEKDYFPCISVTAGTEFRERQNIEFSWGFLNLEVRVYTKDELDPHTQLETILENLEELFAYREIELVYGAGPAEMACDIELISINTDGGLMKPYGVGEMTFQVRYQVV